MRSAFNKVRTEKVVFVGAPSTGKTSITGKFAHNTAPTHTDPTVGASFVSRTIKVDETDVKLDIWDTGGSEKYRALAPMYYRDARGAFVVVDCTRKETLEEAKSWVDELMSKGNPGIIMVLVVNKIDLTDKREVSDDHIKEFQYENQFSFVQETSAMTGAGINELFEKMGRELLKLPPVEDSVDSVDLLVTNPQEQESSCSC